MKASVTVAALAALAALLPPAAYPRDEQARAAHLAVARQWHAAHVARRQNDPDTLILPGLIADRKEQRIGFLAETTELKAGETAEFFLIAEHSGHDYEALAVAFVKPSDVHRALLFLGMTPGRPADGGKLQFWPKGERVFVSFLPLTEAARSTNALPAAPARIPVAAPTNALRIEDLIRDDRTGATMARSGLVFTGSTWAGAGGQPGTNAYYADMYGPGAIAADYNERHAVLDVPVEASQGDAYEHQTVHTNWAAFGPASLIEVRIEPEYKDGRRRVVELEVEVLPGPATNPAAQEMQFEINDAKGGVRLARGGLQEFGDTLMALVEKGQSPFLTVRFDDRLVLKNVRAAVALLDLLTAGEVRVEAPARGGLCYRAYVPNEKFRDRAARIVQPWELRLRSREATVVGTLVQIKQRRRDEQAPELEVVEYPVATPAQLRKALDEHGPGISVILIYAAPDIAYGRLQEYVQAAIATHPTIHVFLEREPVTAGPAAGAPRVLPRADK